MDCHESNTHFSLLGFFKEPQYDEWMEQLFKHEGDCVWTDEEYKFMQSNHDIWPAGCEETIYMDSGATIYYGLKPEEYGSMSIGLYTDDRCVYEYTGTMMTAHDVVKGMVCGGYVQNNEGGNGVDLETVCGNETYVYGQYQEDDDDQDDNYGNIWSLEDNLQTWNDAFDVYKQCQPCKAYDLTNFVAGRGYQANATGDRYDNNKNQDEQDDDEDADFTCNDDAGYDNVNQV
jgi:hypothetical protein